eukprot:TRINITY_DN9019_c0_g1_i8.p1 TRINITY_DN9019_c0_g1~~TRINITY_DN9019_c0_g1_i8.p1  ORF type:complete len:494 (-),score=32.00 TRINITY_DN9019_c0_g1_i8:447-1733(-)
MWLTGYMRWVFAMNFLEALIFGAIISATDPVTVLAVFSKLGAQEDLYALVFGESVMNDAVAIVLYGTLVPFISQQISFVSILAALGSFIVTFMGSMMVGVLTAIFFALLLRNKFFRSDHHPLQSCLVTIGAYISYYIAEGCAFGSIKLSGIVSILFCGIVMSKYVKPNLQESECYKVEGLFKIVATLSETFVFIYIGTSLFLEKQAWDQGLTWGFIIISFIALAWSRFVNVYMNAGIVNYLRPPALRISSKFKLMMWFAGLRGAIAFALSLEAKTDLKMDTALVIKTTTFFIVLVTVLLNGGASTWLLNKLELLQSYMNIEDIEQQEQELQLANFSTGEDQSYHYNPICRVRKFVGSGGLQKVFEPLDRRLSSVLIRPATKNEAEMEMLDCEHQPKQPYGSDEEDNATSNNNSLLDFKCKTQSIQREA